MAREKDKWFSRPDLDNRFAGIELEDWEIKDRSILDFGCAEGDISKWLLSRGAKLAMGIESNIERVTAGTADGKMHDIIHADLNKIKLNQNELDDTVVFDIVILHAILHHVESPKTLLEAALTFEPEMVMIRTPALGYGHDWALSCVLEAFPDSEWDQPYSNIVNEGKSWVTNFVHRRRSNLRTQSQSFGDIYTKSPA